MQRILLMVWLLCTAGMTGAQGVAATVPERSLEQALGTVMWDVKQSGPLLVVNPQGTRALPSSELRTPPAHADESSLRTLAPQFSRQIVSVRSITVLAPSTMVILNSRPGIPDPYSGLLRGQKLHLLMGSLTADQWRALGSPQGLGVRDLSREQQPLFLSILPEPFALDNYNMSGGIKVHYADKGFTLSPEERADVRLRVNRTTEIGLPRGNGGYEYFSDLPYYALPEGTTFFTLAHANVGADSSAFGVALRAEVPNRLKPASLAFDAPALRVPVLLTDAKTVQDLIGRIAHITHREFYADGRVAQLPVWTRGTTAFAGDLLQALCLAVTGTVRKVGPAYVLTSDLEGIGTRHARLTDWARDAQAMRQAALEAADKAAASRRPEQYVGFAPNDPFAFSSDALEKLTAKGPDPGSLNQYTVPLESLRQEQESVIRTFLTTRQRPLSGSSVKVQLTHMFSYIVPNAGVVNEEEITNSHIGLPITRHAVAALPKAIAALPPGLATRALYVSPADGKEATRFAVKARQKGLSQLWVEVPEGIAGQKLLKEVAAAARDNGLEVVAVLRLMHVKGGHSASDNPVADLRDRNLLDETGSAHAARQLISPGTHMDLRQRFARTGDWLRPDSADTQTYLEKRLREAAIPGLSGIAFVDIAPPGYRDRSNKPDPFTFTTSDDFGYTPSMRLTYLRQTGYDPLDLIDNQFFLPNADLSLPFFPSQAASFGLNEENGQLEARGSRTALQDWAAYRYKISARLLANLRSYARKNYPDLPLFLRHTPFADGWWGGWERPDQLPLSVSIMAEDTAGPASQLSGRPLLLNISYAGSPVPEAVPTSAGHFAQWVQQRLAKRKDGWDGIVLDLSALPSAQALAIMDGLADSTSRTPRLMSRRILPDEQTFNSRQFACDYPLPLPEFLISKLIFQAITVIAAY